MQFVMAGLGYTIIGRKEVMDMEAHYDREFDGDFLPILDAAVEKRITEGKEIAAFMPRPIDYYNDVLYNTDGTN